MFSVFLKMRRIVTVVKRAYVGITLVNAAPTPVTGAPTAVGGAQAPATRATTAVGGAMTPVGGARAGVTTALTGVGGAPTTVWRALTGVAEAPMGVIRSALGRIGAHAGIVPVLVILLTPPPTARAQTCGGMQDLDTLGGEYSEASGISADGSVVVGRAYSLGVPWRAFRWTTAGGMQEIPNTIGSASRAWAYDVSADGLVVVGSADINVFETRAFRWAANGGMQNLGTLGGMGSEAYSVSADGSIVVGFAYNAAGQDRAFRWTGTGGMQDLGTLGGARSLANAVSADGSVVVGWAIDSANAWHAFRWTAAGGMQDLGTLPGGPVSEALGTSADGSVVVGRVYFSSFPNSWRAFRWTVAEGMQEIPNTLGGMRAEAYGVSADGSVVVGSADNAASQFCAFRWTAADGMQEIPNTLGGIGSARANAVSADGSVVVGVASTAIPNHAHAFRWAGAELLFRESCDASWTFGPDGIPGWDHMGLSANGRVYESHPGYGCQYGCMLGDCSGNYWDPEHRTFVNLVPDNGVQWQHTRGSFRHDSTTMTSTAANFAVSVPSAAACEMAAFIETQADASFLYICESSLDLPCLRDRLAPDLQKGRTGGAYTCVGLIERAAEEAGLNGGQGFIPDSHESFHVPLFGDLPCLSPEVLSWFAQRGFHFADGGSLCGIFDPIDFILTDPAGNRLGHTDVLGTINEIPGALYTGSGTIEQFLIPNPMPGPYQLQLVGVGGTAGAAVGGVIEGQMFEGMLANGQVHEINFIVPGSCPGDFNRDTFVNSQDFFDFITAFFALEPSADFNHDAFINSQDFFDFLAAFFDAGGGGGGC